LQARTAEIEAAKSAALKAEYAAEQATIAEARKLKEARSYDTLMDPDKMASNQYGGEVDYREVEDDFM
jgi:hypothetical protein